MIGSVTETGLEPRPVAPAAATPKPSSGGGFAAELADAKTKDAKTPAKAPAPKAAVVKNERTDPVEGHPYAEIVAGPRNGMFLNTSGNERSGQAFLKVEREGRTFHVYGTGADRVVFEVKPEHRTPKAPAAGTSPAAGTPTAAGPAPASTPAGTATPAVTPPVTVALPALPAPTLPVPPGLSSPSY